MSLLYILNSVDQVFNISITTTPVKPLDNAELKIIFRPNIPRQSYTEYFIVDDTAGNTYRVTATGKSFGNLNRFSIMRLIKLGTDWFMKLMNKYLIAV